jgi:TolA-binding protein
MKNKYIISLVVIFISMTSFINAGTLNSLSSIRQKVMQQEERIDGLTTIIEGLSASLYELQSKNSMLCKSTSSNNDVLLQKLATMIDNINADYVTKSDLKKALKALNINDVNVTTSLPQSITVSKKSSVIYSEGVRHFVKRRYDEAKRKFTLTDEKHYKPAASNYYLGEIAYYTKHYEDAIFYFKKSAGLYEKASYMDTLLLHTAISLDKIGEKSKARSFYENIIENYKGKKTAHMAKVRLKEL